MNCLYQALQENYKGRIMPSSYNGNCKRGGLLSRGPMSQTNEGRVSEALENRQYRRLRRGRQVPRKSHVRHLGVLKM